MAIETWELGHHEHCCPAAHHAPRPDLRVVPPPRRRRRRRRTSAQVYARRRAVVAVLAVGVMVAGAAVVAGPVVTAPSAPAPVDARPVAQVHAPVVVGPGETVWDLVVPHVPAGADAQAYVAAVLELNELEATAIAPGTVLRFP